MCRVHVCLGVHFKGPVCSRSEAAGTLHVGHYRIPQSYRQVILNDSGECAKEVKLLGHFMLAFWESLNGTGKRFSMTLTALSVPKKWSYRDMLMIHFASEVRLATGSFQRSTWCPMWIYWAILKSHFAPEMMLLGHLAPEMKLLGHFIGSLSPKDKAARAL